MRSKSEKAQSLIGGGSLRILLITVFTSASILWPFIGLSAWHLTFFILLSIGFYISFSYYILPLMVYFSMMLLYWVIVPVIQTSTGVGYYVWGNDIPSFSVLSFIFISVHFLGILIGFIFGNVSFSSRPSLNAGISSIGIVFSLLILLGMISFIGFDSILLPRTEQTFSTAQNYVLFARNLAKIMPALLLVYFILESSQGLEKNSKTVIFIFLLLCLVLISNPINTARFLSLTGFFLVFIAYSVKRSRVIFLRWALAFAPLYGIFFLGVVGPLRHGLSSFDLGNAFLSLQTLEFSPYSIFLDALKIDEVPQGNFLISHLLILIPRALWSEKADSIGIFVAENSGYVFHNVGLNSFVNAYFDYGFLGLFGFSFVFGLLVKNLNPVLEAPSFRNRRFVYGVIFTGVMPMFFRGDLGTAMLVFYPAIVSYEAIRLATRFRVMSGSR